MSDIIPHWLTKQAYIAPDQVAIETESGEKLSFIEVKDLSQAYAKKLAQQGVKDKDHVGVLSNNSISMIIAIHALSYLGATAVLLNIRLTKNELIYQMKDAHISLLLVGEEEQATLFKETDISIPIKRFTEMNQLEEKQVTLKEEFSLDDKFTIIYTSGTTGYPKGVVHTYGNHWWSAIGSALNLGLHKSDKWLAMLPIFHVGGLSIFIRSVIYGMPVFLMDSFHPEKVNELIKNHEITIVSVVTVMLQQLIETIGDESFPTSLRCMLLGGGSAPESLLQKAKRKNIPVYQSYGMTETSSQIVTLSPADSIRKLNSAGKPLFPGQVQIVNQAKDNVGEILVKGPMVTNGYYNDEQKNKETIQEDWLATGDLGYFDEEGFLYIVDRRNDLIISGGENIYPSEIENTLSRIPQIKEVAVVGIDDEKWGKVPNAFIVLKEDISIDEIRSFAKKNLAKYKIPKKITFVNELPRNASNKVMKHQLIKKFGNQLK